MRIMLVDDDARMRQVLRALLEAAGLRVTHELGDGAEALAAFRDGATVDVIITDCAMPRMDGICLVTALRSAGNPTPIIMLSGEHDPAFIIRAIKAGVNNYVPKPIHPEALFEKIWQTVGMPDSLAV